MPVNNFALIKDFLRFENQDDFYFIQLIKRKKDEPNNPNNKHERVVKEYFVESLDYLNNKESEIIELCDYFKARATIRLNRRNYKTVSLKALAELATRISCNEYKNKSIMATAVGKFAEEKMFLVDIDDMSLLDGVKEEIIECAPIQLKHKILLEVPSKIGVHLITKPFNIGQFGAIYPQVEIHKDNPTNLYIPEFQSITQKIMLGRMTMQLCPICGNKRCPKAENIKFKCTDSNKPGQIGELE